MSPRWTSIALAALLLAAPGATSIGPASAQQKASQGKGAVLRALDKVSGTTTDLEMSAGQRQGHGRLTITLRACRYPQGGSTAQAYALLTITDTGVTEGPVFEGWMVASSPALNALDHPRYDVWVLRCIND